MRYVDPAQGVTAAISVGDLNRLVDEGYRLLDEIADCDRGVITPAELLRRSEDLRDRLDES